MSEILDTNVLLRFLVGDVPLQRDQAAKWFTEAQKGEREIIITPFIVAETVFVLESFYGKSRKDIARVLRVFLKQQWLVVAEREVLLAALDPFEQGQHFVDSYLIAWSITHSVDILTFDQEL